MELVSLERFAEVYEDARVLGRRMHGGMDVVELVDCNGRELTAIVGGDGAVIVEGRAA